MTQNNYEFQLYAHLQSKLGTRMNSLRLQAVLWLTVAVSFLLGYDINTEGVVMVSYSEIASACNGDHLELTCTTTGDFLEWNVTLVEGETILMPSYTRIISSDGQNSEREPVITNSTMISFLRTSAERVSPLISTLIINPVSRILNGSRVECIELPRETSESSFTIVHVMDFDYNYPEVNISSVSELFESNHVTVTIKWTLENSVRSVVAYNVSAIPQGTIKFNGSAMAQLILSYNTLYNVSILAGVPCGLNTTIFIVLNYVKCRYPQVRDDAISIMGRGKDPLIKGTTLHFTCSHGLEQIGPNTSTCTDNGVWVPDTMDVECRDHRAGCGQPSSPPDGYIITPYTTAAGGPVKLIFVCQNISQNGIKTPAPERLYSAVCNMYGNWEPDPSNFCSGETMTTEYTSLIIIVSLVAITAFFLVSIIMWAIGFICGRYQYKQASDTTLDRISDSQQQIESRCLGALDEQVHINDSEEVGLDLTENVAYVSAQGITTRRLEPMT